MFEQSLTCAFLMWFKKLLLSYKDSAIYALILRAAAAVRGVFERSITRNYIIGTTKFQSKYSSSVFYHAISSAVNWFLGVSERVYAFFARKVRGGITNAAFSLVHSSGYFRFEYILAAFFALMMIVPGGMWNNAYAVIGALLLCAIYYLAFLSGRAFGSDFKALPVSLVAFALAIAGGVLMTPVRSDGIRIALFFVSAILFAILIWGSVRDEKTLRVFVTFMVSALFIMCLYAVYQNFVGVPTDILLTDVNTNSGMPGRVYSTFDNPNNFAEAIVLIVPFVYAMIIASEHKLAKLSFVAVFAVCMAALAMSYSRSCYVAFAISTIVFALLYDWRLLLPLGIIALVCIPFLPHSVMSRILTIGSMEDTSNSYRIYLWEGVIKLVRHSGLTGIGIGPEAFAKAYPPFASIWASKAPHSHMLYLELLVELGVVGAASFLAFMFFALKKGLAAYNRTGKTCRCIIIAAISAFAGISFTSCAEYIWFYPRVMFVFWIVLGVLLAAVRCGKKNSLSD